MADHKVGRVKGSDRLVYFEFCKRIRRGTLQYLVLISGVCKGVNPLVSKNGNAFIGMVGRAGAIKLALEALGVGEKLIGDFDELIISGWDRLGTMEISERG